MQCAVCGVQFAVLSVQCKVFSKQCGNLNSRNAVCSAIVIVHCSAYYEQCVCSVQCELALVSACSMQHPGDQSKLKYCSKVIFCLFCITVKKFTGIYCYVLKHTTF